MICTLGLFITLPLSILLAANQYAFGLISPLLNCHCDHRSRQPTKGRLQLQQQCFCYHVLALRYCFSWVSSYKNKTLHIFCPIHFWMSYYNMPTFLQNYSFVNYDQEFFIHKMKFCTSFRKTNNRYPIFVKLIP